VNTDRNTCAAHNNNDPNHTNKPSHSDIDGAGRLSTRHSEFAGLRVFARLWTWRKEQQLYDGCWICAVANETFARCCCFVVTALFPQQPAADPLQQWLSERLTHHRAPQNQLLACGWLHTQANCLRPSEQQSQTFAFAKAKQPPSSSGSSEMCRPEMSTSKTIDQPQCKSTFSSSIAADLEFSNVASMLVWFTLEQTESMDFETAGCHSLRVIAQF